MPADVVVPAAHLVQCVRGDVVDRGLGQWNRIIPHYTSTKSVLPCAIAVGTFLKFKFAEGID